LRRWLLVVVCVLLIADGYWASRNLVLKSADDRIYYFRFPPMSGAIYVATSTDEKIAPMDKVPDVRRENGRWLANGKPVTDLKALVQYWKGDGKQCSVQFHLGKDASVNVAIKSINEVFAAGAGRAMILSPVIEQDGKSTNSALFFESANWGPNTCPYAELWQRKLNESEDEVGVGYPPARES
jgi:hypothetical protein